MKKFTALVLILCLLTSVLAGCSGGEADAPAASAGGESTSSSETEAGGGSAAYGPVDFEETVLYKDEDFLFKLTGVYHDDYGYFFDFYAENNSDRNISYNARHILINGIGTDCLINFDVPAGEKINDQTSLLNFTADAAHITELATISSTDAYFCDTDTLENEVAAPFSVTLPSKEDYVQEVYTDGTVLADQDGVKIVAQDFIKDEHKQYY